MSKHLNVKEIQRHVFSLSLSLVEIEYTMLYVRDMRKDLDTGYITVTRI